MFKISMFKPSAQQSRIYKFNWSASYVTQHVYAPRAEAQANPNLEVQVVFPSSIGASYVTQHVDALCTEALRNSKTTCISNFRTFMFSVLRNCKTPTKQLAFRTFELSCSLY